MVFHRPPFRAGRLLGGFLLFGLGSALALAEIRVRPDGDDRGTGTASAPLRTVDEAVRRTRQPGVEKRVVLESGRYELEAPLRLGVEDSGLTIESAPRATPVISGGRRLTGWVRDAARDGLWRITLAAGRDGAVRVQQLFLDGKRLQRARIPNDGFFRLRAPLGTGSPIVLPFRDADLKPEWSSLPDACLILLMKWTDLHVPIRAVDPVKREATLPGGPRAEWMSEGDARYWVENVPEALDQAGEWIFESASGRLSGIFAPGVDPNVSRVVAARLETVVQIQGDVAGRRPVERVVLRGLTFAESDYEWPADGWISPQAAVPIRGALRVEAAVEGTFDRCTFENLGGYALELGRGARRWKVQQCQFLEMGAGGLRLGEAGDRNPDDFTACDGHEITDNRLLRLGRVFAPAVGVLVFQSGKNRIAHNEIGDLFYTAISVGWNWGYESTPCRENVIEFNHLHHVGQGRLSDMGGVYTLGPQPGTVVRNNLIHDVASYDYGGWGLYTDEGSTGILLESNVVYACKSSGFHQHYGKENTVRNNIFAFNLENQLMRTRDEDHVSFFFTNNIVCFDSGRLLGSSWKNDRFVMDRNLYWDTRAGKDVGGYNFAGGTWAAWQARGHDRHSVIADPGFRNADKRDFSLLPTSPALALGFHPIDLSRVGPRIRSEP